MSIRLLAASLLACCLALGTVHAAGQPGYPDHPITLIVPFPAGGPSDALARAVAAKMAQQLGQTIVIDNQGGANGLIGLSKAIKAAPDGYTLAFGGIGTHVANVALYKKLPYDPVADFLPIGPAGSAPLLLVARADLPADDLPGFVAWLGQHKDKASYGSAGVGSISHYGCVLLLSALQLNATHIPYKGVAPAMNDLMGGQVDFMCDQSTTALPQIAGGRVKAIAVLASTRLTALPATATATQAGHPMDVRSWNALFAPRGTPPAVMARLTQALQAAMADGGLRRQMQAVGVDLPQPAEVEPAAVTRLITDGIRRDVPALKARSQSLD